MSNTQEWTVGPLKITEVSSPPIRERKQKGIYAGPALVAYVHPIEADEIAKAHNAALSPLRARLETLRKEHSDSFRLAEGQLAAEKLSGNVAKEEYWKGELAVLHRIRRILSQ